jgi:hypothetical protein
MPMSYGVEIDGESNAFFDQLKTGSCRLERESQADR